MLEMKVGARSPKHCRNVRHDRWVGMPSLAVTHIATSLSGTCWLTWPFTRPPRKNTAVRSSRPDMTGTQHDWNVNLTFSSNSSDAQDASFRELSHQYRVAVVGSGPSGCFTTQALRKLLPNVEITVFDALPTPYGLVRHGIAADHQGAKAVQRQFERLFAQPGIQFVGNTAVGSDIPIATILDVFDAIVIATGLPHDRELAVPTYADAQVIGAGQLLRLLNSDPDSSLRMFPGGIPALGERILIVGTGNVAVDAARLLSKSSDELIASDIDDVARNALLAHPVKSIVMIGRSCQADAKWDNSMIKELAAVSAVQLSFDDQVIAESARPDYRIEVDVHFDQVPASIKMSGGRTQLTTRWRGDPAKEHTYDVDTIVSAIGFVGGNTSDMTDAKVFQAGGRRNGRLGNLAENRKLAAVTADEVAEYLTCTPPRRFFADEDRGLRLPTDHVTFDGWKRIDGAEIARARPGRCRTKFSTREELIAAAARETVAPLSPIRLSEETIA